MKKQPGRTWIEVNNEVHTFVVDDHDHPWITEIRAELKRLSGQMLDMGYVPDTRFVLHHVEEEDEVFQLCNHSEKFTTAFGLLSTHLLVLHFALARTCGCVATATLSPSLLQR